MKSIRLIENRGVVKIKAIIMAGGKGTRLRPLTCGIPKPMVPVFDKPVMEYTLELLKKHKFNEVGITLSYLPQMIIDSFGKGNDYDLNISYFIEKTALGTGGSVRNTDNYLDGTFMVISGDSLTDLNLDKAIEFHRNKSSKATIVLKRVPIPIEYGVIITRQDGRIVRFFEKPSWGEVFSDTVNTGIYILEPEVIQYYKKGDVFDFSKDLFPRLLKDGIPMYGFITNDYWCDIGDLSSYRQTHFDILDNKVRVNIGKKEIEKGIWMGEEVFLGNRIKLIAPIYIGNNTIIENDAYVDSYSIISGNCKISERSKIKRSIIWKGVEIGEDTNITGSVICSNSIVKNNVSIFENTVIGQDTVLLDNSIIKPDIKIWPEKKVYENTIVSQNIIWGTKASRSVFGVKDISGVLNQEITPEFCIGLGSVFALTIGTNKTLVISSDNKNQSDVIKSSIVSGILAAGTQCISLNNSLTPMTRFGVVYHNAAGGIYIYTSSEKPYKTHIEFFDSKGINLNRSLERKIEILLNSGDYNRCDIKDIKAFTEIDNFREIYLKQGLSLLADINKVRNRHFKIILTSQSENAVNIANALLDYLGCDVSSLWGNIENNAFASIVSDRKADLGVIINENGEKLILVDESGKILNNEEYLLLSELIAIRGYKINRIVFPHAFPTTAEEIAGSYGAEVLRTSSDTSSIMNKIYQINIEKEKPAVQYILNYDAIWSLGYILSFLTKEKSSLKEVILEIPEFYFTKNEIPCDWEDKGRIIRKMVDNANKEEQEMLEGVKIKDHRGWALILPDNEKPLFNIYTQGVSQEMAKELSAELTDRISNLLKRQGFKNTKDF